MSDKTLSGIYWEDVAAAAQAIKTGVQKTQLASGVQTSLGKADTALQPTTGLTVAAQAAKTADMTEPVGIDEHGKLWAPGGGWSDTAKSLLLELLNMGVYTSPEAPDFIAALAAELDSTVTLESITASYDQDRPLYYGFATMDEVKLDLVVTAHYSDGSDVAVDGYTLTGEFNVGTNTFTAAYLGKTDTFDVVVTEKWAYSIDDFVKVNGSLGNNSAATCGVYLEVGSSYTPNRRSFVRPNGATSFATGPDSSNVTSQTSDYYPVKVPAGATKFTVSITPATQMVQVLSRQLNDGVYSTLTASGWLGYQAGGGTKTYEAAVGDNAYLLLTTKYDSAGTSYPTEPTAFNLVFE